ncbi:MAG: hypothetical protein MRY83_19335 [Flavobacteriales bacterium]|nr:hypothetical protein [Flavobacteriales bacterium]
MTHAFNFNLDFKDYVALNKAFLNSKSGLKRIRVLLIFVSMLVILIMTMLDWMYKPRGYFDWKLWVVTAIIFSFLMIFLGRFLMRFINRLMLPLRVKVLDQKRIFGRYQYEISEESVKIESPLGNHEYKWDRFCDIQMDAGYAYLYVTKAQAYILPLSKAVFLEGNERDLLKLFHNKKPLLS